MEVTQILHMNKGDGDTSYAQNSEIQRNMISNIATPTIGEAVLGLLCGTNSTPPILIESMGIADLGCSCGPTTFLPISEIIDVIHVQLLSSPSPGGLQLSELRVYLNDLFSNDFNAIFMSLPAFHNKLKQSEFRVPLFISAVPGSFYGRLFPAKSMHFVHSSSSLHWLSQVPSPLALNKGKIYISKTSPKNVLDAYSLQFRKDFSLFLKSRAEELVGGGRMVLSFMGRPSSDPTTQESCHQWELLALALMSMVSEGLIEEEKVDDFNIPYYAPCAEELQLEVEKDESFIIDRLEAFEIERDGCADQSVDDQDRHVASGQRAANSIRVVAESMLESHFGKGLMMDHLFRRYAELVGDYLSSKSRTKYTTFVISVTRK